MDSRSTRRPWLWYYKQVFLITRFFSGTTARRLSACHVCRGRLLKHCSNRGIGIARMGLFAVFCLQSCTLRSERSQQCHPLPPVLHQTNELCNVLFHNLCRYATLSTNTYVHIRVEIYGTWCTDSPANITSHAHGSYASGGTPHNHSITNLERNTVWWSKLKKLW